MSWRLEEALGNSLTYTQYSSISHHLLRSLSPPMQEPPPPGAEPLPLPLLQIFSLPPWCQKSLSDQSFQNLNERGLIVWEEVIALLDGKSLSKKDMEMSWWSYLGILWRILRVFEEFNRLDAGNRVENGNRQRGLRLFSLLPLYSFRAKHITIDTDSLHSLWCLAGFPAPILRFREDFEVWWNRAFKLEKVTSTSLGQGGRQFEYSIKTDGISASVVLRKELPPPSDLDEYGWRWGNVDEARIRVGFVPLLIQENVPVVGLDPGRRDLYTCSSGSGPTRNGISFSMSTKTWRNLAGITRATLRRESWIRQSTRDGFDIEAFMTGNKVWTF